MPLSPIERVVAQLRKQLPENQVESALKGAEALLRELEDHARSQWFPAHDSPADPEGDLSVMRAELCAWSTAHRIRMQRSNCSPP